MSETLTAPAAAAAPAPAPSAPAPVAAPASSAPSSSAPAPASTPPVFGGHGSTPTTHVDPSKFPVREDFARELLREKLAAVPAQVAAAEAAAAAAPPAVEAAATVTVPDPAAAPAAVEGAPATPAPDAVQPPVVEEEEVFRLDPPITIATPEILSRLLTEKPEFGQLLEKDKELKGALYKTAREAAELRPYREIFPDVDGAKKAQAGNATWNDVRDAFDGSTTRDGTVKALAKIAELSYERDDKGDLVIQNGRPVIGEAFYGFTEQIVAMDHENQVKDLKEALEKNLYRTDADRASAERLLAALEIVVEESSKAAGGATEDSPEALKRRTAEVERREQAVLDREHGQKVQGRTEFDAEIKTEAQTRITDSINRILANVEKQGAHLSPYLKKTLPRDIGARTIAAINANQGLKDQMADLQKLPVGSDARTRRLAAIDRAIQEYLPNIAREELRDAGVQIASSSATRTAKETAQQQATQQSEVRGATGPASGSGGGMTASAAFDAEQSVWQQANPGKPFDKVARESILSRVLERMRS